MTRIKDVATLHLLGDVVVDPSAFGPVDGAALFRVAIASRDYEAGSMVDRRTLYLCRAFGPLASAVLANVHAGDRVTVTGRAHAGKAPDTGEMSIVVEVQTIAFPLVQVVACKGAGLVTDDAPTSTEATA